MAFSRELVGNTGTSATRRLLACRVTEDESGHIALGAAWPGKAQWDAGGAWFCTKDRFCFQLPVTVCVGMFS